MKVTLHSTPYLVLTALARHDGKMPRKDMLTMAKLLGRTTSAGRMAMKRLLDDGLMEVCYQMTPKGADVLRETRK